MIYYFKMLIYKLPQEIRQIALHEYEQKKRSKLNGYLCRWFGFYRLYTRDYGLFVLFLLSIMFIIPGLILWIYDGFRVSKFVESKNQSLEWSIYMKYKQ